MKEIEHNVTKLTCHGVVGGKFVMGYKCQGFRGKFEPSFLEHTAEHIDLTRVKQKFHCHSGTLVFDFDEVIKCKSRLKKNSEYSTLKCYPISATLNKSR